MRESSVGGDQEDPPHQPGGSQPTVCWEGETGDMRLVRCRRASKAGGGRQTAKHLLRLARTGGDSKRRRQTGTRQRTAKERKTQRRLILLTTASAASQVLPPILGLKPRPGQQKRRQHRRSANGHSICLFLHKKEPFHHHRTRPRRLPPFLPTHTLPAPAGPCLLPINILHGLERFQSSP